MTVTITSLRVTNPEFEDVTDALITALLVEAEAWIDGSSWPSTVRDQGVRLLACDKIARSPFGGMSHLIFPNGETIYSKELQKLTRRVGGSYRWMGNISS